MQIFKNNIFTPLVLNSAGSSKFETLLHSQVEKLKQLNLSELRRCELNNIFIIRLLL